MRLFDSHCHLDFDAFDSDRDEVLSDAAEQGIDKFMLLGVSAAQWQRLVTVTEGIEGGYYSLGLHPYFITQHQRSDIDALRQQLEKQQQSNALRAIGEIGLDGECDDMELQQALLREQLRLAREFKLPVILHHRKTLDKMLKMVRESGPESGVVHAFSGSYEQGKAWVDEGYYLGIGGTITYQRASKTRDAVTRLPLESMVLETDSPDMPVCGFQGQRNEPARMVHTLKTLAQLKSCRSEDVAQTTYQNACRLFSLQS